MSQEEEMVSLVPGGQCVSIWLDQRCRAIELSQFPSFQAAKKQATERDVRVAQLIYEDRHGENHKLLPEYHFRFWRCPKTTEDGIFEHNTTDWDPTLFCRNVAALP